MEKHRCKPSLTRCPFRGRNCCRPRSAGHKSSSDTHHDEEPVVRSSAYFYTLLDRLVTEKLTTEAETIAKEGWKWISLAVDFPYGHAGGLRELEGKPADLSIEEQ